LPQSDVEAARLYKLAADQGNPKAQVHLGLFYREGRGGMPQLDYEAARFFRLAADQGDSVAQANLGFLYEMGRGVIQSRSEAVSLYRLAARRGNDCAQKGLARFCSADTKAKAAAARSKDPAVREAANRLEAAETYLDDVSRVWNANLGEVSGADMHRIKKGIERVTICSEDLTSLLEQERRAPRKRLFR
jgi:TPR repeat protein